MKILIITPQHSFPPSDGGKMEIYHSIKALGSLVEVCVAVPRRWQNPSQDDDKIAEPYKQIGASVILLPAVKPESPISILKNIFESLPFKIQKYQSKKSTKILESFCRKESIDAIWVIGLHCMPLGVYLKKAFGIPIYFREHNVESDLVMQYSLIHSSALHRAVARWQYNKTLRFEKYAWGFADRTCFISDSDIKLAEKLGFHGKQAGVIFPIIPVQTTRPIAEIETEASVLYPLRLNGTVQNAYSAKKFINDVWLPYAERNPRLQLHISGSDSNDLEKIGISRDDLIRGRIRPLGFVDNLAECIRHHRYIVSPTFFGSGIRIKLIEAMGLGSICLCTPLDLLSAGMFKNWENLCCFQDSNNFEAILMKLEADVNLSMSLRVAAWETATQYFGDPGRYYRQISDVFNGFDINEKPL